MPTLSPKNRPNAPICSTAALAVGLLASTALAGGDSVVIYPDATGSDIVFRVSRDGSVVLRSFFPTASSTPRNDRWTEATGVTTLPNPASGPWIARSLNSNGTVFGGVTNPLDPGTTPNAGVICDLQGPIFLESTSAYSSCVVAPSTPGSPKTGTPRYRAFLAKPVTGIDFYRPVIGYVPHSSPFDSGALGVQAADIQSDRCAGYSLIVSSGQLRTRPFLSVEGAAAVQLPLYAPDTDGEVVFFANTNGALLMKTWRTLPDGSRRYRLIRWENSLDYDVIELPSGATTLDVYGVDDGLETVVFNAMTPSASTSPYTIWTRGSGFMTAYNYLTSRGIYSSVEPAALGISGDGTCLLAGLANNTIVFYRGLGESACGGNASCYTAHSTPGCSDESCCVSVCAADPFCCGSQWDVFCVDRASQSCLGCGDPASGGCYVIHPAPGCADAACCTSVCADDIYCCEAQWDTLCANRALVLCRSGNTCAEAKLIEYSIGDGLTIDTQGIAGDDVATPCGTDATKATWRILRPTCSGVTEITLCTGATLGEQGVITVFDACGGTPIACSNDSPNCSAPNTVSVKVYADAGEDLLVRFSAENGGVIIASPIDTTCTQVCGTGESCTTAHPTPGCNDATCCQTVCTIDPYCCVTMWDSICASESTDYCFDPADINRDGSIDASDLSILLSGWGGSGPSDINGDGTTDAADLSALLAAWG